MLNSISLRGFKSADLLSVKTKPLTVFSGLNGSGKSSVLQALALVKQSLATKRDLLSLHGSLLKLGRGEDVLFEDAEREEIEIVVETDSGRLEFHAIVQKASDALPMKCVGDVELVSGSLFRWFQYIQADRIVPAPLYGQSSKSEELDGWLGTRGELAVDFLGKNWDQQISANRQRPNNCPGVSAELLSQVSPTLQLLDQVNGWLQQLSPGVRVSIDEVSKADATKLLFEYVGTPLRGGLRRPVNVGFGLTYSLPILVACLAAPSGALLLLENPEAHLHPRGQFALGTLLAQAAADDVQILVETHSDHVLNGIRVAAKGKTIISDDIALHFFKRDIGSGRTSVISPSVLQNGRLSEWPDGFFDEWTKALDELVGD